MKKSKQNPFLSISDLMAGVASVVMLLLVVSVVRNQVNDIQVQMEKTAYEQKVLAEKAEFERKRYEGVEKAFDEIQNILNTEEIKGIRIRKNPGGDATFTLDDQSFESGSACLGDNIRVSIKKNIAPILVNKLTEYQNIEVYIEGHTDASPWKSGYRGTERCAVFDDNYTLSAARAREARRAVLDGLDSTDRKIMERISVMGYGADRLLNSQDMNAPENRRVEIRLVAKAVEE